MGSLFSGQCFLQLYSTLNRCRTYYDSVMLQYSLDRNVHGQYRRLSTVHLTGPATTTIRREEQRLKMTTLNRLNCD